VEGTLRALTPPRRHTARMTAMPTVEQIADAIDQRLADAGRELASLQAARAALVQESRATSRSATTAAPRSRTRRSAARSSSQTRQGSRNGRGSGAAATTAASSPAARASRTAASTGTADRAARGATSGAAAGTRTRRRRPSASQQSAPAATTPAAGDAPARSQRGGRAAAPAPRTSRRRSRELDPAQIVDLLRASANGLSLAALAKELNVGAAKIRTQLNELQRSGQVRSEGSRRTSRWRLVTDEERIADRVAELERAQSSRSAK
jgi:hypothetical protein